jgi:antitoxin (DNA-binding transcriptional repressor) of toxin-antitoxin stability system
VNPPTFALRDWANNADIRESVPAGEPAIITHDGRPRYLVIRLTPAHSISAAEIRRRSLAAGLKPGRTPKTDVAADLARERSHG